MGSTKNTSKFHVDGIPPLREAIPLGLQHIVAMMVTNMVPAILIANVAGLSQQMATMMIQGAMLAAGIGTLIQLYPIPLIKGYKIGSRLPAIAGLGYIYLGASLTVAAEYGLATLFGSQLIASLIAILFGIGVKKIRHIFTPLISGIIVTCMAIGLFPIAVNNIFGGDGASNFGDPKNLLIGGAVAIIIICLETYGKGLLKDLAILIGVLVGCLLALPFNMLDFAPVANEAWISIPKLYAFGLEFRPEVIAVFTILSGVAIADIMGGFAVLTSGAMDREVTDEELSSGVIGIAVASVTSSALNTLPLVIFGQNSAITAMNKVVSRFVVAVGTVILLLAGISPKVGSLMTILPNPVVGGATLVIFASIAMSGIRLIVQEGFSARDAKIAGIAITFSIGLNATPDALSKFPSIVQTLLGSSTVVTGAIVACILVLLTSFGDKNKKEEAK